MRAISYTVLVLCIAFLGIHDAGAAGDSPSSRRTLRGLPGIHVGVPHTSGCEQAGAYGPLVKTEVESQLRRARIKVFRERQRLAVLTVVLTCFEARSLKEDTMVFHNIVRVDQVTPCPDPRNPTVVTTWRSTGGLGVGPKVEIRQALRKEIRNRVGQFIEAWRSVNPLTK